MRRSNSLGHLILGVVVALSLTPLMIVVDAQGQIAFTSNRDGNFEIYVTDADGDNQYRLTDNRVDDQSPSWSPAGNRIVFQSNRGGTSDIYVMGAAGKNPQRLTKNRLDDFSPSWSPDGKRIAFTSFRGGTSDIYVMDADGDDQRNLTKHGSWNLYPAWYTPPLAVAPAGKALTMWGRLKRVDR